MRARAASVAMAAVLGACSSSSPKPIADNVEVPERSQTLGDRVLGLAPRGAEAVLELDVERLRGNAVVGSLARAMTEGPGPAGPSDLSRTQGLVLVSYRIGLADAAQLVFAVGPEVGDLEGGARLRDDVVVLGPEDMVRRAEAVAAGVEEPLTRDLELMRARSMAMPSKATGASLRASAYLGFEARLALARRLDIDVVPAWLSLWSDVADDFAAVALIGGDGHASGENLAKATDEVVRALAARPVVSRLGLTRILRSTEISISGNDARAVLIIGPRRLARLVELVASRMAVADDGEVAP